MTLGTSLDRAAQDPFVCRLLAARNVGNVVTGSTPFAAGYTRQGDFPAFERVGPEKGFTAVARSGEYRLWRVPRCRG